jgi:hypothetical protein
MNSKYMIVMQTIQIDLLKGTIIWREDQKKRMEGMRHRELSAHPVKKGALNKG